MKHLDQAAALALAEGGGDEVQRQHAVDCDRCRRLVERSEQLLDALRGAARDSTPPRRLLRWARAYATTVEPADTRWRVLQFLSQGATLVAATRAAARAGVALLYGDEHHQLDIRIEPTASGRTRVHGQVVPLADATGRTWEIHAVGPQGESLRASSDDLGEFWLDELASWSGASLVATSGDDRIVVARLGEPPRTGDDDEPS